MAAIRWDWILGIPEHHQNERKKGTNHIWTWGPKVILLRAVRCTSGHRASPSARLYNCGFATPDTGDTFQRLRQPVPRSCDFREPVMAAHWLPILMPGMILSGLLPLASPWDPVKVQCHRVQEDESILYLGSF